MIRIKRVYETPDPMDGFRILVDRLWPRGLSKEKAAIGLWLGDVAPSSRLRAWFSHQPEKWPAFQKRYAQELPAREELLSQIRRAEKEHGTVTLLLCRQRCSEKQCGGASELSPQAQTVLNRSGRPVSKAVRNIRS